nr:MAG TPA: hypothetical protein [Caudoviricetes sp.]
MAGMAVGESNPSLMSANVRIIDSTRVGKGTGKTTSVPVEPRVTPNTPHWVITPSGDLLQPHFVFIHAGPDSEYPVVKLLISGTCPVSVPTFLVAASPKPTFLRMTV